MMGSSFEFNYAKGKRFTAARRSLFYFYWISDLYNPQLNINIAHVMLQLG